MGLLQELYSLKEAKDETEDVENDVEKAPSEEEDSEKDVPPAEDEELEDQAPTESDDAEENEDEGTDEGETDEDEDETGETEEEDVGSVSQAQGFKKSSKEMYAFGKTRKVTLLTKNEDLGGLKLTLQYVINPETGAWSLRACLAGQSEADMVEFDTGEDPTSLVKSLKKKRKITPHQAVEYLNPPADKGLEAPEPAEDEDEE